MYYLRAKRSIRLNKPHVHQITLKYISIYSSFQICMLQITINLNKYIKLDFFIYWSYYRFHYYIFLNNNAISNIYMIYE